MSSTTTKITVLQLIGSTGLYGAERWVLALMRALDADKVDSILMNLADAKDESSAVVAAAHQRGLTALDFFTGGKFNPLAVLRLTRWIKAHRVDVVHAHGFKSDVISLLASRISGCRMITTPHGWSLELDKKLQVYEQLDRRLFRFMDMVCPLSPELTDGIKGTVDPTKLRLVLNGVDVDEVKAFCSVEINRTAVFTVGYIGRLVEPKDLLTLLAAVRHLMDAGAEVKLMMIGDGPHRLALEEEARRLEISTQVEFLGFKSDAATWLKNFDVFVLPSLSEGIPRCIMEAMAASLPVVASDIPGNRNLVSNKETGLLFPPGDSHALSHCLNFMRLNPLDAQAMALRGNQMVEEKYSNKRMAIEYSNIYHEVISK